MYLYRVGGFVLIMACAFAADPTLHISEADAKKATIESPAPVYPMMARQMKVKGTVRVEAVVAATGSVSEVRIVSGNLILAKPAADAVKKWRFHPFQEDGKAASALVSLSFEFDTH